MDSRLRLCYNKGVIIKNKKIRIMRKNNRTIKARGKKTRQRYWLVGISVVIFAAAVIWLWHRHSNSVTGAVSGSGGTPQSPAQSVENHESAPSSKNSSSQSSSSASQGGARDNSGDVSSVPPSSQWTTSSSGNITLYSPAAGGSLKNGSEISGSAKVGTIRYRLIDDKTGQLAQGSLSVVNGKFSGSLQFRPDSSSGKLDIFSYTASYAEINRIEIKVNLET